MQKRSFADMECPIAQALEQIGEWWSLLILRDAMLGARFFGEFEKRLSIAPTTLTRRLNKLCEHGLLEKRRAEDKPMRDAYLLTEKGEELMDVLVLLGGWSNKWIAGAGREQLRFVDVETEEPILAQVIGRKTQRAVGPRSVRLTAGPGASPELRARVRTKREQT